MAEKGCALITGGARRIGRALVAAAADAGYDVAIHVRHVDDEAEAAAAEVRARRRKSVIVSCDLRKESEIVALVGQAEAELGPVCWSTAPASSRKTPSRT
jgi:NAD(P)-dependent dehydrogenase (short-subunit alcohol dehydrogenase family)